MNYLCIVVVFSHTLHLVKMGDSNSPLLSTEDSVNELLINIRKKRKDPKDVVEMINEFIKKEKGTHRIFSKLLKFTNGNKIIQDCLDTYVKKHPTNADEDDDEYAIRIDFRNITTLDS